MKKFIIFILSLSSAAVVQAQVKDVAVDVNMDRNGDYMVVDMDFNFEELHVDGNTASLYTPWIVGKKDSLELSSVGIYGRQRYYYYLRNLGGAISGDNETTFLARNCPDTLGYNSVVPYALWMDGAVLKLCRNDYGCCHVINHHSEGIYAEYIGPFIPDYIYVQPAADSVKIRQVTGSAFVDFPVSKTVIYPEYRNNTVELGKINASIDEVRNNPDVEILSISLKGFASPESPYSNNTRLAAGRTQAIKEYIMQLYKFKPELIGTDSEPENWEGLRKYVEESNLDRKDEILARIDSDQNPDKKEAGIKKDFPAQYSHLLKYCYPALRRTDYTIEYKVVTYNDVRIIADVMRKAPQNLSQNEFYLLAETYEPGSSEFNNVFETAVLMFPDDAVANLNAANIAMSRGELDKAKRHLSKAGDSPETSYAKGIWHMLMKEHKTAKALFEDARDRGVGKSWYALDHIERIEKKQTINNL